MKTKTRNLLWYKLMPILIAIIISSPTMNATTTERHNFYCEYCGHKFPDIRQLTSGTCSRHPMGTNKGRHKLYEGREKAKYGLSRKIMGKELF